MKSRYRNTISALSKSHGLVLLYHSISDDSRLSERRIHNVSPNMFERHLSELHEFFRFVSMAEFVSAEDPAGLATITFDDGYRNVLTNALPILEGAQIPASLCVNSSVLQGQVNWRDKVRFLIQHDLTEDFMATCDLPVTEGTFYRFSKHPANNSVVIDRHLNEYFNDHGIEITQDQTYLDSKDLKSCTKSHKTLSVVNHGARHYVLSSLTDEQQVHEINEPRLWLSECFRACLENVFSAPFGGSRDINHNSLEVAVEAGYHNVLMSRQRLHRAGQTSSSTPRKIERFMPRAEDVVEEVLRECSDLAA
ncbi:MAG: polysaccharide deacetylase family protein [Gammaproteobacteria bacterium]|nr:polysaccharide deacetylase family protein [Gammaproteobacteria bacterium]